MSVVIHEVAHGYSAYAQGDITAYVQGRLTLNPVSHVDIVGSIIVPGVLLLIGTPFLIGWAKPVPFNPWNLRNQRWGPMWVALAGPASNVFLALVFALGVRFIPNIPEEAFPLLGFVILINLVLAIFNMIPVPPLDGSKVLFAFLPQHLDNLHRKLEQYGLVLAIVAILLFAPVLSMVITEIFVFLVGPQAYTILMSAYSLI